MAKVVNFVLFQLGWFACVLGAAWGYPWAGPVFALVFVVVHLLLAARPGTELRMIGAVALLGCLIDSGQTLVGALVFPTTEGGPRVGVLPLWMVALWVMFAGTMNCSLQWMQRRFLLALVLGAVSGPLCFLAGQRLGALQFDPDLWFSLVSIGLCWGLLLPVVFWLARWICVEPQHG